MIVECEYSHLWERAYERGYSIEEVMSCVCRKLPDGRIQVDTSHPSYPAKRKAGPGTALKVMLRRLGFHATTGCPCNDNARLMNAWGSDGCRQNIQTIVGWLKEEAKQRNIPAPEALLKTLVHAAIRVSESRRV